METWREELYANELYHYGVKGMKWRHHKGHAEKEYDWRYPNGSPHNMKAMSGGAAEAKRQSFYSSAYGKHYLNGTARLKKVNISGVGGLYRKTHSNKNNGTENRSRKRGRKWATKWFGKSNPFLSEVVGTWAQRAITRKK